MSQVQSEEVLTSRSPPPLSTTEKVFDTEKTLREIGRALGYLKSNPSWWTRIYTQCFQVVNAMAKAKEPQPQLCNLLQAALELALSVDKDCVLKLAGEEADAFMCLVQKAIDFTPHGHKSRGHFMKILMDVAIHSHVFPRILTLDDITDRSEHPLYAGGFGDVWRASWRGRSVALKSPRLTLAMNDAEKAHKNLCREVLLWRQLNHPHLLEFLGVCKYSSLYTSIVSPWMENGTVLNFVKACPKVDRIKLLKQVASALSYLHEHDPPIVHQDVRGINILVNDKQDAVLGDFGLSRIDNNFFASMASTMQHGCTRWQAPELLFPPSGEIPSTSWATDMWSFGMVVLELFTECLPFAKTAVDSAVIIDIYHGRKPDRPVDSEVKAPGLSDRVWACAEKCWAKSPSDRPRASVLVSQLTEELAAENTTSIDAVPDAISAQGFSRRAPPSLVATLWRSVRARRRVPSRETRILLPDVDIPAITTAGESKLSSPQLASPTAGRDEESSNEPVCSKSQTVQHGALRIGEPTQMVNNYASLI
ncbi:kinase-like protein [Rickenella mellea]|uniref:Kinase-like protein n=1 Tax=Rickenella mellea TaxID=50990 RepID=A0A4Y7PTH2_9AGAM|nr:kinase-like protein [Rickenella mellea]